MGGEGTNDGTRLGGRKEWTGLGYWRRDREKEIEFEVSGKSFVVGLTRSIYILSTIVSRQVSGRY